MSACKICGNENTAQYRPKCLQTLCNACAVNTPRKLSRSAFDAIYWDGPGEQPCEAIKREFYSDYLASTDTVETYKAATTEHCYE